MSYTAARWECVERFSFRSKCRKEVGKESVLCLVLLWFGMCRSVWKSCFHVFRGANISPQPHSGVWIEIPFLLNWWLWVNWGLWLELAENKKFICSTNVSLQSVINSKSSGSWGSDPNYWWWVWSTHESSWWSGRSCSLTERGITGGPAISRHKNNLCV